MKTWKQNEASFLLKMILIGVGLSLIAVVALSRGLWLSEMNRTVYFLTTKGSDPLNILIAVFRNPAQILSLVSITYILVALAVFATLFIVGGIRIRSGTPTSWIAHDLLGLLVIFLYMTMGFLILDAFQMIARYLGTEDYRPYVSLGAGISTQPLIGLLVVLPLAAASYFFAKRLNKARYFA